MGFFRPPDIKKMKAQCDIEGLIEALGYRKEERVRKAAVQALAEVGGGSIPLLIRLFRDFERAAGAEAALVLIGAPAAPALLLALDEPDNAVRTGSSTALAQIIYVREDAGLCRQVVAPLTDCLDDSSPTIRLNAVHALNEAARVLAADRGLKAKLTARLAERLYDIDEKVRQEAAFGLAQLADVGALNPLIASLKDPQGGVRSNAARGLGRIGDVKAVLPLLVAAYSDPLESVRQQARAALLAVGAPARRPLVAALRDNRMEIRMTAAEMLDGLGWQPADDERGVAYWIARGQYARCAEVGLPAVDALLTLLRGPLDDAAAQVVAEALIKIGAPAVEALLARLPSGQWNSMAVIEVLGRAGDERVVMPLIEMLDDKQQGEVYHRAAAEALVKIGGGHARQALILALHDQDELSRRIAADALDRLGWQPDMSEAGAWYWIAKGEFERCVKIGAAAVGPLISTLYDRNTFNAEAAAMALGELGDLRAIDALGEVSGFYPAGFFPSAAAKALRQIGGKGVIAPLLKIVQTARLRASGEAAQALSDIALQLTDAAALLQAVGALVDCLSESDISQRRPAALALRRLYYSGKLDIPAKQKILAVGDMLDAPHYDYGSQGGAHADIGIGVEL
jgi:HEAT repeat protein